MDSQFLVVGLSHRTAPLDTLERVYETPRPLDELILKVSGSSQVTAAMVVRTCNRIEVYAEATLGEDGRSDIPAAIAEYAAMHPEQLHPYLYEYASDDAVRHLFQVAAGLDSMVLGEEQILGQVRDALVRAQDLHTASGPLNQVGQAALRVGKRVRNESGLNETGRSLATVGLAFLERHAGTLHGKHALLIGAGAMAGVVMAALRQSGLTAVHVANRTPAKAQRLAETGSGTGFALEQVPGLLGEVDLVVSCTAAGKPLIQPDHVRQAVAHRQGGQLFLLDLSLPHDIAPEVADLPEAVLVGLPQLVKEVADDEVSAASIEEARAIVGAEVDKFKADRRTAMATPILTAMRTSAAAATEAELDRLARRLDSIDVHVRKEIDQSVRRIVDKVLHLPTVRARQLATTPDGAAYVAALGKLFAPETHASTIEKVLI